MQDFLIRPRYGVLSLAAVKVNPTNNREGRGYYQPGTSDLPVISDNGLRDNVTGND